jgi:2,5-furandicarboxylate decarboxylase 1
MESLENRNELLRISEEVDPKFGISAYIRKSADQEGPALLFENVKGYDMPVVGGILGCRRRLLMALEVDSENVYERFDHGVGHPIPPRLVETGPCQEVIMKGDEVDLTHLPIPTYAEKDGGAFITHGIQISKDPEDGSKNASMYRMQFRGKRELNVYPSGIPGYFPPIRQGGGHGQASGDRRGHGLRPGGDPRHAGVVRLRGR